MATRKELLEKVVDKIKDYRAGEIASMNIAHVDKWVQQFPVPTQEPILAELGHVFSKAYFTKSNVEEFLTAIAGNDKLTGGNPKEFWKGTKILKIQTAGNSQNDMLAIFDKALQDACGLSIAACGGEVPHGYVYIDDVLFSGGRIKHDIVKWIKEVAPQEAKLAIVTIAYHSLGQWRTGKDIAEAAKEVGKKIDVTWWRVFEIEDRKAYMTNSDVLRPTMLPADPATVAYVQGLNLEPVFRTPGQVGARGFFSSEQGRGLLEQQFLVSGVGVRAVCPYLNAYMRPLGKP